MVNDAITAYFNTHPMPSGQPPSDAQVQQAVQAYMAAHPIKDGEPGTDGADATPEEIAQAVADYMAAHPVKNGDDGDPGKDATDAQVAAAVSTYLTAHPPQDGQNATADQVAQAVAAYLTTNPPKDGKNGTNATDAQVASAVSAYLTAHPPAAGKSVSIAVINGAIQAQQDGGPWVVLATLDSLKGGPGNDGKSVELQKTATAIQWRQTGGAWDDLVQLVDLKGNPGNNGTRGSLWSSGSGAPTVTSGSLAGDNYLDTATGDVYTFGTAWTKSGNIKGLKGDTGPSPLVSIGTVNCGETATIAISAGFRTLTITQTSAGGALTGLVPGDNVLLFPVVTAGAGIPDGYAIHNAWCSVAGTLKVRLSVPLIALGNSYAIPCRVVVLR